MKSSIAAIAALALVAGCAPKTEIAPLGVDRSFTLYGGEWDDGSVTIFAAKQIRVDDRVGFCGAYARDGRGVALESRVLDMLGRGKLLLDDVRMVTRLNWFADGGSDITLSGVTANCVETTIPWRAGYADAELTFEVPTQF